MRLFVSTLALVSTVAWAVAAETPAKVRTGYEVKGLTHYVLVDGKVVQIDPNNPRNAARFWIMQDRLGQAGGNGMGADAGK